METFPHTKASMTWNISFQYLFIFIFYDGVTSVFSEVYIMIT